MVLAGGHLVAVTSPAYSQGVQPVPYSTSGPVPYSPTPTQAAPPPPPPPATAGKDVIHLKNGGMLRGTIIDAIPNSHARIQLPTGEIATVQWSEIARIESGDQKPAPPPPEPPSTAWKPPPPPPEVKPPPLTGPKLLVHIDSSRPVRLARYETTHGVWDDMCDSPCDKMVPVDGDYRIEGVGVRPSARFAMQGKEGDRIVLDVNAASKGWFAAGIVGGGVGLVGVGIGLYVVLIGAIVNTPNSFCSGSTTTGCKTDTTTQQSSDSIKAVGWTIAGVGLALSAVGVIVLASNWSTSVAQETQVPVANHGKNVLPLREAQWRDDDIAKAMPKQQVYVPIFTRSF